MAYNSFYEYLTALNRNNTVYEETTIAYAKDILLARARVEPQPSVKITGSSSGKTETLYPDVNGVVVNGLVYDHFDLKNVFSTNTNIWQFNVALWLILGDSFVDLYTSQVPSIQTIKSWNKGKKVEWDKTWSDADKKKNCPEGDSIINIYESTATSSMVGHLWNRQGLATLLVKFHANGCVDLGGLVKNVITFYNEATKATKISQDAIGDDLERVKQNAVNFLEFFTGDDIDITSSPQFTQSPLPTTKKLTSLLKQKGQIILKGPPGTGKTRLAQMVAEEMTVQGCDPLKTSEEKMKSTLEQREIIQFHPSYSYEDFIMGLEVGTKDETITYEMKSRGIKAFADLASLQKRQNFVLIIDEINRAPVSSVFGELMYALEYRGEEITLSSSEKMTLPKNLYIIGTMNTADRSIAELDYAMQRRFDFVEIPPTEPSELETGKLFAKSLYNSIQGIFKRENIMTGIDPKDVQLGTSYFICNSDSTGKKIDQDHLNYKINYQIIPLLTEYYKDGVFRKKQVMFDNGTFEYWLQENKTGLAKKLEELKCVNISLL